MKYGTCKSIFRKGNSYQVMEVESVVTKGLYKFSITGLIDKRVREAETRIISALRSSSYNLPYKRNERVIISLLPVGETKSDTIADLAIVISYLLASGQIHLPPDICSVLVALGDLQLDGKIRAEDDISHIFSLYIHDGYRHFILPKGSQYTPPPDLIYIYEIGHINELVDLCTKIKTHQGHISYSDNVHNKPIQGPQEKALNRPLGIDLIHGSEVFKRALHIALAGKHPIIFGGAPGLGKTTLADSCIDLLPDLQYKDALQLFLLNKISQKIITGGFYRPPVVKPDYSITRKDFLGDQSKKKSGLIHIAHFGVLILNELSEFSRPSIESLRNILDFKNKQDQSAVFDGICIATTNMCPCGNFVARKSNTENEMITLYTNKESTCRCTLSNIKKYQAKISYPILSRFQIRCTFENSNINSTTKKLSGLDIKNSIRKTRDIQKMRNGETYNAHLEKEEVERFGISPEASIILHNSSQMIPHMRSKLNIMRVARTIADIDQSKIIESCHILESMQYVLHNPFSD